MTNKEPVTIVAFGDSITEAAQQSLEDRWPQILWQGLLKQFPGSGVVVVNAGIGGNTTREGLARIEKDVLRHNPRFVLVEFGNDATPEPARHVTFEEFTANLNLIRTKVAQRSNGEIVLLTFPPIIDSWHSHYRHEFYLTNGGQDAYQEQYRKLTRQFARTHAAVLLDIDKKLRKAIALRNPEEYILKDGVHLTAQGNHLVGKVVLEFLSGKVACMLGETKGANKAFQGTAASGRR
jgi:lysophospholipase L1-like esterase